MNLEGKKAIITGSSKGIGKALCLLLLEKGANVGGWSRSASGVEHDNFLEQKVDVTDPENVKSAYAEFKDHFGGTSDVLVNNAGLGYVSAFEDLEFEKWRKMFSVNVDGIYHCTKEVIPDLKKKEEGHIINIASIAGLNGVKNMAGYVATKHAVRGISHSLFQELRDFGIKVSCIYPGSVKTEFFNDIDGINAHDNMMRPEDIAESIVNIIETHPNLLTTDIELRPLKPRG